MGAPSTTVDVACNGENFMQDIAIMLYTGADKLFQYSSYFQSCKFLKLDNGRAVYEIGSGNYNFISKSMNVSSN